MLLKRILLIPVLCIGFISFFSCNSEEQDPDKASKSSKKHQQRGLEEIKKDGKLKALTTYSNTSYFLYRGQAMGYEYELLKRFADYLDVELEVHISHNMDSMINQLKKGDVDIVAHGLTITSDRKEKVNFTDYLFLTHQVLVQKKPDNWRNMHWSNIQKALIHDAIELIGDTVSVRKNSSYLKRIKNLSKEIGGKIHVDTLDGSYSTDEIIKMVADGDIEYTIADNNIASIMASYYPILDIDVPVSFSQRIGWAVRKDNDKLLAECNAWLAQIKDKADYYVIYNKYFKNQRNFRKRVESEFYSLNNNKISKYDDLIKKYAQVAGWDWRLLASQVYQESRFEPHAKSWAGARGLMQLMPATAQDLRVKSILNPEQNIRGGTKYLSQLYGRFDEIKDSVQRIKFTLASYNCGYGHVRDAQRLAQESRIDHKRWDESVEKMIRKLSYPKYYNLPVVKYGYVRGIEPYVYVKQIFQRYRHYKKFIKQ